MRSYVLICYDIADPKRWRRVFDTCQEFGEHLQYSIFLAALSRSDEVDLRSQLVDSINEREDRVMLINLGPENQRTLSQFKTLGTQWIPKPDEPFIF